MKSSIKLIMVLAALLFGSQVFADDPSTTTNTMQPSSTMTTSSTSDATIVTSVQQNIANDSTLKGFNITPSSSNGVVTLDGTVDTQAQANAAISAAKSVTGVSNVKSNLVVKNAST